MVGATQCPLGVILAAEHVVPHADLLRRSDIESVDGNRSAQAVAADAALDCLAAALSVVEPPRNPNGAAAWRSDTNQQAVRPDALCSVGHGTVQQHAGHAFAGPLAAIFVRDPDA